LIGLANRATQILDVSNPSQWKHVPTKKYPANLIPSGIPAAALFSSEIWWNGLN